MTIHIHAHISPFSGSTQMAIVGIITEETKEIGINIKIKINRRYRKQDIDNLVKSAIEKSHLKEWIFPEKTNCFIDCEKAKKYLPSLEKLNWFKGKINLKPEVLKNIDTRDKDGAWYQIYISKEEISKMRNKIFLSHKHINKDIVRQFSKTLTTLKYETWLDEDVINAGDSLDRVLLEGMKNSCAAVFFITPDFTDKAYLKAEIDYAITQKREKDEGFQIITLSMTDKSGERGVIPELLKQYVWKEPKNDLEALREIIKSIPLTISKPTKEY